ncbi:MAG TPA: SLBB domain-containing protein [Terracidiphilus sp.]|nr:SLBB domain-containing protein [Terracidiphilus sp.]
MNNVMFDNPWICSSGSRWNRVCGFLLTAGLVVLLCGIFTAQSCEAQTTDQAADQSSYQQTDRTPSQQMGQTPSQQTGQATNQQAGETQDQQTMSAEQIISILEQEPDILESIKNQVAQLTGADPTTISDEALYERVRQDASLRILATRELIRRGYSADLTALNSNFSIPANVRSGKETVPQTPKPSTAQGPPYENPDDPQVQHRLSPYKNIPSLSDLYSQFPSPEKKLRRFGSDAFLTGTGNVNELPMDLPAGPDYVLGPGDSLTVNMWGAQANRLSGVIDRQGQIALPEVGTIMIDGMTITQAQSAIQKALDTQFQGEHVEISLGRLRTVRVYVVGDVQRPGAYDVSSLSTSLSALYAAGGPTTRGSLRILRQYRGKQLVRQVDLYDLLLRGVRSNDDRLLPGDTILVPPVGPQVSVEGMVHRPAIYELNGEEGLNQVLELAGGVLVSASLKQINVERIEAHQSRSMFSLQLPENQDEVQQKLAAFKVKDGDDVLITQILPYNAQAVYLEGHVFHPGKYPYHDGMTINDLLHSYQDILPEPSDHAELIRLLPPDFRPETINLNLPDVLIGNNSIPLQPFDLIRVYSRYEIDSPSVSIEGEVLRPGKYPMSQGMTVAGLVRMAGGFRLSAYRDEAGLTSYVVQNGQNVLVGHSAVDMQKALAGDKSADALLKPGDVVSIRRLAGWEDIGSSVTITGEVEHGGSYGISEGERLSSVLKRAGGFRTNAYPYAAIMERVQVRKLNEQAREQVIRQLEETPVVVNPGPATSNQTAEELQKSLEAQRQQVLTNLRSHPVGGRLVISITADISKWENTPADITLRAGDTLFIPKRPDFVMASGQVYNPVAITYVPGKTLGWYFHKAGGITQNGNKNQMYVLRADGSVLPKQGRGFASGDFMDMHMRPGDTIFVPERAIGASMVWQNIIGTAQVLSAIMLPLAISGVI